MGKQEQLTALAEQITSELDCPLKKTARHLVFGKGNPDADIFIIGEAPGAKEDEQGVPFVGRAGKKLNSYLNTIGLTIDDVYIANILKYRPPKNRDPTSREIEAHTPYLLEQITIVQPKLILTLGNYSTKFVLGGCTLDGMKQITGISSLHGKQHEIDIKSKTYAIIPLYHPAALLYNPKLRPDFEKDLLIIAKYVGLAPQKTSQQTINSFQGGECHFDKNN
ncbi:MAG: uracil-DNA glycosylase [Nanobdellota archaeon]